MSDVAANREVRIVRVNEALVRLRGTPIYVWLCILVLLPNALMLGYSFFNMQDGAIHYRPTVANYGRIFSTYGVWYLLVRTILISITSATIAALIAYPMALYASRLRVGKMWAVLLVIIPLWISLLMRIFAWRIILGEKGVINSFLIEWGVISEPIKALLYSPFAVFLTFVYVSIPFVFVSVFTVIDRIPTSLMQAASDCGANPSRTFWSVTWPLSRPGLTIGLALGFLIAVGDYVTPSIVGGLNGTMIGMVIAAQFGIAGNWPYGSSLSVIFLILVTAIVAILFIVMRVKGSTQGDGAAEFVPTAETQSGWALIRDFFGFALFCLPYAFLYAPLALLAVFSINDSTVQTLPLAGITTKWYQGMIENGAMMAAFRQSIFVGFAVLVVSIVVGTCFAVLLSFGRLRYSSLLEKLLLLPLALPGIILGITLVLTFHLLVVPPGFFRLVLGHSTFVMPVIMSVVIDRLRRLDPALIEASMDLGASPMKTFFRILLPLVGSAVFAGALLGFTLSVDEVVVSTFLVADKPTLPVWVWNQMRFGFTPSVNAIFVCIGLASFALILVSQALIRRRQ
jgi:spermidine/putrescine transport system permease protein